MFFNNIFAYYGVVKEILSHLQLFTTNNYNLKNN